MLTTQNGVLIQILISKAIPQMSFFEWCTIYYYIVIQVIDGQGMEYLQILRKKVDTIWKSIYVALPAYILLVADPATDAHSNQSREDLQRLRCDRNSSYDILCLQRMYFSPVALIVPRT